MKTRSVRSWFYLLFVVGVVCRSIADADGGSAADTSRTNAEPYPAAVRQFADQFLVHSRDTYGKPTPLFANGLNVGTREPAKWKWADGKERVLCNLTSRRHLFYRLSSSEAQALLQRRRRFWESRSRFRPLPASQDSPTSNTAESRAASTIPRSFIAEPVTVAWARSPTNSPSRAECPCHKTRQ